MESEKKLLSCPLDTSKKNKTKINRKKNRKIFNIYKKKEKEKHLKDFSVVTGRPKISS